MNKSFDRSPTTEMIESDSSYRAALQPPSARHLDERLEKIGFVLDQLFRVPGTQMRFGLDPIIGLLLPVVGDWVSALLSIYIVVRSIQYGLPKIVIGRMVFNVALDYLIGSIPAVGDLLDFAIQPNKKNVELLNRFAEGKGRASWTDYLWLFMLLGLFGAVIIVWLLIIFWLLNSLFALNYSMNFNR